MRILGTPDADYYLAEGLGALIDALSQELAAAGRAGQVVVPAHMFDRTRDRYVTNHWAEVRLPARIAWGESGPAPDPLGTESAIAQIAAALHELARTRYPAVASPLVPEGSEETGSDVWDYVPTVVLDGI